MSQKTLSPVALLSEIYIKSSHFYSPLAIFREFVVPEDYDPLSLCLPVFSLLYPFPTASYLSDSWGYTYRTGGMDEQAF